MQKTPIFLVAGVVVVALVAGGYYFMNSQGNTLLSSKKDPVQTIEEALTGTNSVKCEYTDEAGQKVVAYIKAGKMRSDIVEGQGLGGVLYKDSMMWTWDNETKQGFMMDVPEGDDYTQPMDEGMSSPSTVNKSELEANIEKYKQHCKEESINDSVFEPPTDVVFQNMGDLMKSLPQMPQ